MAARGRDPDTQLASPCKQGAHSQVTQLFYAPFCEKSNIVWIPAISIFFHFFHLFHLFHLHAQHRLFMHGLVTLWSWSFPKALASKLERHRRSNTSSCRFIMRTFTCLKVSWRSWVAAMQCFDDLKTVFAFADGATDNSGITIRYTTQTYVFDCTQS